jgi:hypothetical protein
MKRLIASLSFAALLAAPVLHAHTGPLDPAFGDGGMQHYGFQPVAGGAGDSARVGCPGPGNTFVVMGAASAGTRIVTTRLRPDGSLDPAFSDDGKESFDFVADYGSHAPAVCLPQGDAVIAGTVTAPSGEQNLRLVRVGRDTGLPVPGFGSAGVVDLDLDLHIVGLAVAEVPVGLNVLGNGDLVVTGYVSTPSQLSVGFAALLDATGTVRAAKTVDCWMTSTAIESPQGALWVFGSEGFQGCRLTLDRNTLAQSARLLGAESNLGSLFPGAARAVRGDTVAMAATVTPPGVSGVQGALVVFRGNTVSTLVLPSVVDRSQLRGGTSYPAVQILPGGRVLYGSTAIHIGSGHATGMYLALARIGRTPAGDRLETAFGGNGVRQMVWQPDTPNCTVDVPRQWLARMTQWLGRPAFVGKVDAACLGINASEDYLVGRIETNYLFADGFD